MIARYTREKMAAIWSDRNRYATWLKVEIAALEAMAAEGLVPAEAVEQVKAKADFDPRRIEEIEAVTRHDVIAFLTNVAEYVGEPSRWVHHGMTSSDVLDTAYNLQLVQAADLLLADLDALLAVLKRRAFELRTRCRSDAATASTPSRSPSVSSSPSGTTRCAAIASG